jgi:hypothetical protein
MNILDCCRRPKDPPAAIVPKKASDELQKVETSDPMTDEQVCKLFNDIRQSAAWFCSSCNLSDWPTDRKPRASVRSDAKTDELNKIYILMEETLFKDRSPNADISTRLVVHQPGDYRYESRSQPYEKTFTLLQRLLKEEPFPKQPKLFILETDE